MAGFAELLKKDLDRYRWDNLARPRWLVLFTIQGAQATFVYRFGHWIYSKNKNNVLRWVALAIYYSLRWFFESTTGISISPHAEIGPGLYIGHFGSIIIGSQVIMGENCNISQGVTIGASGRNQNQHSPRVGNRVYIAPGAKLFGDIEIGDDVAIGANAVVTHSVPSRFVVGGIPAKKISDMGSFDLVMYLDMDLDSNRIESLEKIDSQ